MKNPMAGAGSLQEYEIAVDRLIGNLILMFAALLTLLELLRESSFLQGLFVARYAIATGIATLLVRNMALPLMHRGVILLTIPTILAAVSAVTDPFFVFVHHIFFILIIAASLYFHAQMLLAFGVILNVILLALYFFQPTGLFGSSENPGDIFFVFALLNGGIFILYHVMQWVRLLLVEVLRHSERLKLMAYTDFLTGVCNRASLLERLESDIQWAEANGTLLAVAAVDIDNFKEINDTFGHTVGDQVLVKVAERIRSCTRSTDTVARVGGDEFCLLLTGIRERTDAIAHMKQIIDGLAALHSGLSCDLQIQVSVGLAFYPQDAADPPNLLNRADKAMYQAKRSGKNCLRLSDEIANFA